MSSHSEERLAGKVGWRDLYRVDDQDPFNAGWNAALHAALEWAAALRSPDTETAERTCVFCSSPERAGPCFGGDKCMAPDTETGR